jgi:hypothetical protein
LGSTQLPTTHLGQNGQAQFSIRAGKLAVATCQGHKPCRWRLRPTRAPHHSTHHRPLDSKEGLHRNGPAAAGCTCSSKCAQCRGLHSPALRSSVWQHSSAAAAAGSGCHTRCC